MWKTIDRISPVVDKDAPPILSQAVQDKIRSFLPRYDQKRAALLPALHVVQDALGHVPHQAMVEVAKILEIHPSAVLDTISFYTHYWTHEKGKKVVTVCRSISCELMGGRAVLDELKKQLAIDEHGTTKDGKYSLVTEECLAGCDHAPCLLINEKLHKRVKPEDVKALLADENNDKIEFDRSDLYDAPADKGEAGGNGAEAAGRTNGKEKAENDQGDDDLETTSDVQEMRDAD